MTTAKVTYQAVEVLHRSSAVPKARVTYQAVEVLYKRPAVSAAPKIVMFVQT